MKARDFLKSKNIWAGAAVADMGSPEKWQIDDEDDLKFKQQKL